MASKKPPAFDYQPPFELDEDDTEYRLLGSDHVRPVEIAGRKMLEVEPAALELLAQHAFRDCSFLLREKHLRQVGAILDDPDASENDRYVAGGRYGSGAPSLDKTEKSREVSR